MKFSKIGALLLTLACLLLPFSSATAAGAGVWDLLQSPKKKAKANTPK